MFEIYARSLLLVISGKCNEILILIKLQVSKII